MNDKERIYLSDAMTSRYIIAFTLFIGLLVGALSLFPVWGAGQGTGHNIVDLAHLSIAQAETSITSSDLYHGSMRFQDTSSVTVVATESADGTGGIWKWHVVAGAGGSITTVVTEDPVSGDGTIATPVTVADNAIDDTHIDWGLTATQVNGTDLTMDTTTWGVNLFEVTGNAQAVADALDNLNLGPTTFLGLTDTPSSYTGQTKKVAAVNTGETALEFVNQLAGDDIIILNVPSAFFLEDTASDVGGYKEMNIIYLGAVEGTVSASITGAAVLIEEWITPALNTTTLVGGISRVSIHAAKTAGSANANTFVRLYLRHIDTSETLIGTSGITSNLTASNVAYDLGVVITSQTIVATDRLVAKFYGNKVGSGSNPTVALYYQGTNFSNVTLPVGVGALITLDMAYDNGEIVDYSEGDGAVEWNFPSGGTATSFVEDSVTYNVVNHIFKSEDNTLSNSNVLFYNEYAGVVTGIQYNMFGVLSINGGTNKIFQWGIRADGVAEFGDLTAMNGALTLGDSTTEGTETWHDGDGETVIEQYDDLATSVTIDNDAVGAWTSGNLLAYTGAAGAWELVGIDPIAITPDTNTESESIRGGDITATNLDSVSFVLIAYPSGCLQSGTANRANVYINSWVVDGPFIDTVTFTLYVGGIAKDSWTTVAGAAGISDSGISAISEALTAAQQVDVRGKITTVSGAPDAIACQSWSVNNQIL